METISQLGRRFGLSRSTLLYYDRIGVLPAPARSSAGYRRYGEEAARRLELVCLYRSAGVPLAEIRRILGGSRAGVAAALEQRLAALRGELARLRAQQDVIVRILRRPDLARRYRGLDREGWVALLQAVGLDQPAMGRFHAEFEQAAPDAHQEFLEALRIPPAAVRRIRREAALRPRRPAGAASPRASGRGIPRGQETPHARTQARSQGRSHARGASPRAGAPPPRPVLR